MTVEHDTRRTRVPYVPAPHSTAHAYFRYLLKTTEFRASHSATTASLSGHILAAR